MSANSKLQLPGMLAGIAVAPAVALGSLLRRSRLFHPSGVIVRGLARPVDDDTRERDAGAPLAGHVFARSSSGWWKTHDWPDVLGCALRFSADEALTPEPRSGDQDLLLATIRHPLTTLLAPLSTHADDYLRNYYFGVSPFRIGQLGTVKLRLSAVRQSPIADTREQRLMRALELGPVQLILEARAHQLAAKYRPILKIELSQRIEIDQRELRFDPFATGRGLVPSGFVHAMRIASYAASRKARHVVGS
jgi:hypothetical protein